MSVSFLDVLLGGAIVIAMVFLLRFKGRQGCGGDCSTCAHRCRGGR